MEIPLQAQVECSDGICGRSVCVLINPILNQVTCLVVKLDAFPNTEHIVPVIFLNETIVDTVRLSCSRAELEKMAPFIKTEFVEEKVLDYAGYQGGASETGPRYLMPYVTSDVSVQTLVDHLQIPPGDLAVRRGTRVEALDGYAGLVDEFVINPENSHITYLVMREGHLWGDKNVIIPLSAMGDVRDNAVFLNIDKHQIEALPTFPLHRRWS